VNVTSNARQICVPRVLDVDAGAIQRLPETLARAHFCLDRVLVLCGGGPSRQYGDQVVAVLTQAGGKTFVRTVNEGTHAVAEALGREAAELDVGLLIGVGGGRVVDVAKSAAHHCDLDMISVPTSIANDGISSPVAALKDEPTATLRAGVGDLVSNLTALLDWRLADQRRKDTFDAYSALIADGAARPVLPLSQLRSRASIEVLAKGLVLSGLAMATAGTSRPCSGAEHLISHSLDVMLGPRAGLHGEQVALGTIVASTAHGQSPDDFRGVFTRCGLPVHPSDLDLSMEATVAAVQGAPATRPNRYTVLNEIDLSSKAVRELLDAAFTV
jgi:glycerol-1-phosphate dehydrogenase [NAD(P)+]